MRNTKPSPMSTHATVAQRLSLVMESQQFAQVLDDDLRPVVARQPIQMPPAGDTRQREDKIHPHRARAGKIRFQVVADQQAARWIDAESFAQGVKEDFF